MSHRAMQSKVGNPQIYNNGDQRNPTRQEKEALKETAPIRHMEGQPGSHQLLDSKDEKSISNKLDAASKAKAEEQIREREAGPKDPLAPAQRHGNKPSRGAEVDAELQAEDEEYLRQKGKAYLSNKRT